MLGRIHAINNPILFIDRNGEDPFPPFPNPFSELVGLVDEIANRVRYAVQKTEDKAEEIVEDVSEGDALGTTGDASNIIETAGMIVDNATVIKTGGTVGTVVDGVSVVLDAATTDFTDTGETTEFVENTAQVAAEAIAGPMGVAVSVINESAKDEKGVTNTRNMSRNFQMARRTTYSYYSNNFLHPNSNSGGKSSTNTAKDMKPTVQYGGVQPAMESLLISQ